MTATRRAPAPQKHGYLYACRDHLTPKREAEIQERERVLGWREGGLR